MDDTATRHTGYRLGIVTLVLVVALSPAVGVVSLGGTAAAAPGDAIHRANAGGSFTTTDGDQWDPLTDYLVSGGQETSSHGQPSSFDSSVPSGTPSQIWGTERWDPDSGDEMNYEFDVPSGTQVEVRLYFYDGYSGTSAVGDRVFDVSVEDQTIEDFDIIETYGDDTGAMESFTVTSDGTIDVDFAHVTENPQINAIEIVEAGPEPGVLDATGSVDFGTVVTGQTATETVTLTNAGESGDADINVSDVAVTGTDAGDFSTDFSGGTTLAPGESLDVQVTFDPSSVDAKSATLEVTHDAPNTSSPLTVDLTGEGASDVPVGFSKSTLQGFSAGNPTAIDFGPDGRAYVSTQGGTVYALNVTRDGDDSYQVTNEVQIDAIKDIPNHDDLGNLESGESNRQITGLTAGGTASQPVVYVSSSDPEIDVGTDDDDTDTNSGAISRLTMNPGSDGTLQASEVDHDVMVLGLPRSEENHATNGLDLTPDGDTLYVAQGGHTNKGAPGDNFGHTPEYALSAAVLEIDLAQIENDYQTKNLNNYNSDYPNLEFYYGIPTIQNDDATDGDDLPFGGNDGVNQAKLVEGGPVQIYSPGYRNPYDLVLAESGQLYVSDHGPNGGWGGQPADASGNIVADAASVTNHPNEDGSFSTNDQLVAADEGEYGGHAAPIRANPTQADIYDANGDMIFDINESNSPVPSSMVNPVEADYIPPTAGSPDPGAPAGSANTMETESGSKVLFGPTGGTTEYTASNFGGAMEGDILQVELGGDIERVELTADGQTATNVETLANTGGPLGITAQDDDEAFAGTIWTANHGGNDITVFEPNDYDGGGEQCDPDALEPSGDADGDGYTNGDELAVGTDPCSSASTPADFDDDGEPNELDPDDDNDGLDDTEDPFAVDPNNGVDTTLPVQHDLSELSLFGENGQGWTGLMANGQDDYQALYDPTQMTVGGAAEVLTVEGVPPGDAYSGNNDQQYAFQFGATTPDEPFVVETTVASFPENPENFQSAGLFIGTGDQSNYVKLVAAADGGNGGVEFAKEVDDTFTHPTSPNVVSDSAVAGNDTTLRLTVDPTTDPDTSNSVDEVAVTAEYEVDGTTTEVGTAAMPASWLDTSDGVAPAFGIVSTSNGASSTFDATWTQYSVEYVNPPNQPPVADAGADQTVDENVSVQLDASGSTDSDGDDGNLTYAWTQTGGPSVSLSDTASATPTFTAPDVDGDQTLSFEVEVTDEDGATDNDTVDVTVQDTDVATGEVVFAVNSGGSQYTATDGTVYQADANFDGGSAYSTSNWASSPPEINNTDDDPLYRTERYGQDFSYNVPLENGTYQVTLKFAEIYQGVAPSDSPDSSGPDDGTNENDRVFDVTVEGQQVIENKDLYAEVGPLNATDETYTVEVTDGELNVAFPWDSDNYDNAKISAIKVVAVEDQPTDEMTVAEAVASYGDGDDSTISLQEMQTAITWWSTGSEVPDTGGETISLSEVQQLIEMWSTGATVGDGSQASIQITDTTVDGDNVTVSWDGTAAASSDHVHVQLDDQPYVGGQPIDGSYTFENVASGEHTVSVAVADTSHNEYSDATDSTTVTVPDQSTTGSALVEITPDSGLETSTYGDGTYQVTNTGEKNISSVSFDLSTATLPDMVFDPQGTAGDPTGEGLNIVDEGGTGITTAEGGSEAFSQPHNGQNADDGYDVMTVEFSDFESGEQATFWADNDPTSIKGATVGSQEAGPVSGLELARSTVTVTYEDGTTHTTQLMGDGSAGGSTAVVNADEAPAPTVGAQGVSLDDTVLDDYHSAATVSSADQTITVTGQPGETVTLVRVEGELTLTNVPDADNDGEPGYDIEAYEANDAEDVEYYTATLDSNGEATIPVTLTNTTADGDGQPAGLNYFVAAHGQASGDMGLASNVVVLELDESAGDGTGSSQPVYAINAGGSNYTAADGTEYVADTEFGGSYGGSAGTSDTTLAIGNTEDDPLYQTERYGDPLSYSMPVQDGTYEVTLHFAEIWHTSETGGSGDDAGAAGEVGDRVFNVSAEGQQVLTDYDIYAEVGGLNATQETFTVEVTDGSLDLEMPASADYAKVSAIEVENASDGGGATTTSADVSVTPNSGIDSSTFNSGSLEVTNTGDAQISSVTFDASESLIPDAVFDPQGTAGDAGAKGLEIDSESGDGVGVVSTADGDVFSQPHNGVNGSDGYDAMTVEFGDFDPGETVTFSVDMDPTTIKDVSTTGGEGSVSGLEISGTDVSVSYADGSTQTTDLFGDGSDGGAQASAAADDPAAPTLGVDGVSLQPTDFPAHEAATVGSSSQTLTLSGPAGATVQLLSVEASEPPTDGYDVEAFEADNAESVSYQTVTLDSNGQTTVSVSLSESNLNYFVASVEDGSGETGQTSNTVILDVETNAAPSIQSISDQTVVSGETVTVPVSASDSDGDSLTLSKTSGPSFVTLTDDGNGTGTLEIDPQSADAGTYTVEVAADDGSTSTTESFQLTVDTATSVTSGTALHRVNAGGSTVSATDSGPDWTGVTGVTTDGPLVSTSGSNGNYNGGDDVTPSSSVPSSTPASVYDAERYGPMTWEFNVTSGSEVEVRLYLSNQFPQASSDGDRQYNVSVEGQQQLTQYDPVQDVGHANGTVKAFTVTENGDGTVTITFEEGAIENPQVNAIEIVESSG